MSQNVSLIICFGAGAILGVAYFTGLWVTVRRLPDVRCPWATLFGSFLVRMAVLVTAFALLMDGRGAPLAATLTGFLVARSILVRRLGLKR